jgi:hypothetical protein
MTKHTSHSSNPTQGVWPLDSVRNMGVYLVASKGSGKSRWMGRWLAKQDCRRGIPQVILDPVGGTIDNLLDCLMRLPPDQQRRIWPQIVYVDMGATDYVVPMPLYYRLSEQDSLYQIAQRYLDTIRLLDPHLQTASVEGWNALWQAGTYAGMAMAALGGQIVDVPALLTNPKPWKATLKKIVPAYPDLQEAATWLTEQLPQLKPELRARRTTSFLQKIALFTLQQPMRAMFGASTPSIDWQQVIEQGQTVLFDFRHVLDIEQRRFRFLWALSYFLEFIKHRGAGRHSPIGLIVDEVSVLTNLETQGGQELFSALLDELLNVWGRQGQVWTTISHQEVWQVSERLLKTLMGCGTLVIGRTSDFESAMILARDLIAADPHRVKRYDPVYGKDGQVIDRRPVEYSLDEQQYLASLLYKRLGKFRFVTKSVDGEGGADTPLRQMGISQLDEGIWPDDERLKQVRNLLRQKSGTKVETLLAEINQRQQQWLASHQPAKAAESDTVTEKSYDDEGYEYPV